tara:strand:+ start:2119 stop:2649 length:531 start_codon:yes stop_codon:yes gene_type:complete
MEEDISFFVSEKTLSDVNLFLRDNNKRIIQSICNYKKYDNEKLLNEILPSTSKKNISRGNLSDKERCMARLWKGGYGGRCQNARKNLGSKDECEFCNSHYKEIINKGKLRYGRIDEISPFRLPKNPDEPYKRCMHIVNNKQCRCRMSDNSKYCTMHTKTKIKEDIGGVSINLINIK